MKSFYKISFFSLVLIILACLTQCTTIPKLEKEAPTTIKATYFQQWNAGVKEEASGIDFYIELNDVSIRLDSVLFRGQTTKLKAKSNDSTLYVGRFKSREDTSNKVTNWPFQIENNACIISYSVAEKIHYFKVSNVEQHITISYPSTSLNNK